MIEQVHSTVTIYGDLTAAQRTRLAQVASRCPVHKTLDRGLQIIDAVSFPDAEG
jgi:putative redox protein